MDEWIDVSGYQPESIDWNAVRSAGIVGVLVKATDGIGSPDPFFESHCAKAHAAGLLVGGTHFLRLHPEPERGGAAQADEFAARFLKMKCNALPALDVEPPPQTLQETWGSPSAWNVTIHQWIAECRAVLKVSPMVYSYPYFWTWLGAVIRTPTIAACPSWWADYSHEKPIAPPPWGAVPALHQYTDTGTVPGIPGHVDRSRSSGGTIRIGA